MKTAAIIIPNWNGKDLLEKNLPSIMAALNNSENQIVEVIVVDDKSTDDSITFLQAEYRTQIKLVKHTKNRGFSSAVNTGVRSTQADYVVLLNSDTRPTPNFLKNSLVLLADPKVFAVGFHEPGRSASKGYFKDGFIGHLPALETRESCETFWVNGGSGIFKRNLWISLGGLDEVLLSPLYWEDVDIGYRALKRGYKLLWDPKAIVYHDSESTTKKLPRKFLQRIQERNQLLFIWKNLTSRNLFRKHLGGLVRRLVREPGYIKIVIMALAKFGAVRKARAIEQHQAKVSDEAIFSKFK